MSRLTPIIFIIEIDALSFLSIKIIKPPFNDEQIEKIVLSEEIIKEPIDRIVQVQKNIVTTSRAGYERTQTTGNKVGETRIFKVTAYCSCAKCCGKTNGITASGTKATAGRTVATSSQFSFGTQLDILFYMLLLLIRLDLVELLYFLYLLHLVRHLL